MRSALRALVMTAGLAAMAAYTSQGAMAQPTHAARTESGKIERVKILRDHGNDVYDVILYSGAAQVTLTGIRLTEVYPLSPAETETNSALAALAQAARLELEAIDKTTNPGAKTLAERRLTATLEQALERIDTMPVEQIGTDDLAAVAELKAIAERQPHGRLSREFFHAQESLRNRWIDAALKEAQHWISRGRHEEALARLETLRPQIAGAAAEREYDRLLADARVGLGRALLRGGLEEQTRGLDVLRMAAESGDARGQARAALLLAEHALARGAYDQAGALLERARALRGLLSQSERLQCDLLARQLERPRPAATAPLAQLAPADPMRPPPPRPQTLGGRAAESPLSSRGGVEGYLDTLRRHYKRGEWLELAQKAGLPLAAVIVGYLLLWAAPARWYIAYASKRYGMVPQWQDQLVAYGGVFAVAALLVAGLWRKRDVNLCPKCHTNLNNPRAFGDLVFDVCPFCGGKIKPFYDLESYIRALADTIAAVHGSETAAAAVGSEEHRATMQALYAAILAYAVHERASDVHIERDVARCLIRLRVDGILRQSFDLPQGLHTYLVTALKSLADMDVAERRLPQDGHFHHSVDQRSIHVRVSTMPTNMGEKMVLRLLDPRQALLTPERLGFSAKGLEQFQRSLKSAHGLILATGPTGSGKTTLLYAALSVVNDGRRSIFTVEDPIEYHLPGINQIAHNEATGLTFATALKSILRQDPDIIMVGEIRDFDTARMAVNAAQTGHLVLSTLHTLDACAAIARLVDIGIEPRSVANAVLCIVAQRLVRTICPQCAQPVNVDDDTLRRMGLRSLPEGAKLQAGVGCEQCGGTGYLGRTGVYEVLTPNSRVRSLMDQNAPIQELRAAAMAAGMRNLRQEAIVKALQGVTTVEEVLRVTADLEDEWQATAQPPNP